MEKLPQIKEVKHRIPAFDILRVFLLILVVNIHREHLSGASLLFTHKIEWYAVPVFIILSFYLTSSYYTGLTPSFNSIAKRVKRFFIPFLFWSLVGFIADWHALNIPNLGMQLVSGGVVNVPLYYLLIMSLFTLFFWGMTFIPSPKRIITMIVLALGAFYLQYSGLNYNFFSHTAPALMYCYGRIAELLPFAVTGILLGVLVVRKTSLPAIMLLTALVGGLYFASLSTTQPQGVDYSGSILYFGSTFTFLYFLLLRNFQFPESVEKKISLLGAYSLGVFVSHYLILEAIFMLPWVKDFNNISPLGFLLCSVAFCYVIIIGLDRLTHYRFSYLFK